MKLSKLYFIVLVFFSNITFGFSQSHLMEGDSLYVWAKKGLNFRASDDINSNVLELIPFGSLVTFIHNRGKEHEVSLFKVPSETTICTEYKQKGYWIKIKHNKKEGYVFSGFLSRYSPKEKAETINVYDYVNNNYKLLSVQKKSDGYIQIEKKCFEDGIYVKNYMGKVGTETFIFPDMTLEEGMLLLRNEIKHMSNKSKFCIKSYKREERIHDKYLEFICSDNYVISIQSSQGMVIITYDSWC